MFTPSQLLWRGLRHHWRVNLAVVGAVAVAVAVLCGALAVGDSVRASLRGLTLERLGRVDQALVADHYFREQVAAALPGACPLILLNGSVAVYTRAGVLLGAGLGVLLDVVERDFLDRAGGR